MYYIGIDLGTSAVKLLLMDGEGKILNVVSRAYPLMFPHPGWSEQDPDAWIRETWKGIAGLTKGYDKSQIAGIGAGGQMHGLVVLDENDQAKIPGQLRYKEKDGYYWVYINVVTGVVEEIFYIAGIGGNG